MKRVLDFIRWITCMMIGHRWVRFGYPSKDDDMKVDDTQLFVCLRCNAMPMVKHNGILPRWIFPIHWIKSEETRSELKDKKNEQ